MKKEGKKIENPIFDETPMIEDIPMVEESTIEESPIEEIIIEESPVEEIIIEKTPEEKPIEETEILDSTEADLVAKFIEECEADLSYFGWFQNNPRLAQIFKDIINVKADKNSIEIIKQSLTLEILEKFTKEFHKVSYKMSERILLAKLLKFFNK